MRTTFYIQDRLVDHHFTVVYWKDMMVNFKLGRNNVKDVYQSVTQDTWKKFTSSPNWSRINDRSELLPRVSHSSVVERVTGVLKVIGSTHVGRTKSSLCQLTDSHLSHQIHC